MKTSIASHNLERNAQYHVLRCAYENAFHDLVAESSAVRALTVATEDDRERLDAARARLERATAAYRHSRDTLSEFLLRGQ